MSSQVIPEFPVGYRIRRALEISHVEPDAVAARLGVGTTTVWNYIGGRTRPKRMALTVIAEMTRVPLWWLEGGSGGDGPITDATTRGYLRRFRLVAA